MYAPLALAFVTAAFFSSYCLTHYFLRAPVVKITVNATSSSPSSSKTTSHTGAIAGGVAGGVVALILLAGTIVLVRRRRRRDDLAGESFSSSAIEPRSDSQMAVTPFNPTLVVTIPPDTSSPAWTTSDGPFYSSEPTLSPIAASIPIGLTGKELARLRSAPMVSTSSSHARSSSSGSQPTSPPTISSADQATATPTLETRRLQTEVESLRREMQQLRVRAERFEAPPSYGDGGGV